MNQYVVHDRYKMAMYLDESLVQAIDRLENGRVGKGQGVGAYPDDISVFGVEGLESDL